MGRDVVSFNSDAPIELIVGRTGRISGAISIDESLEVRGDSREEKVAGLRRDIDQGDISGQAGGAWHQASRDGVPEARRYDLRDRVCNSEKAGGLLAMATGACRATILASLSLAACLAAAVPTAGADTTNDGGNSMNQTQALEDLAVQSAYKIPPESAKVMGEAMDALRRTRIVDSVLAEGAVAPDFELIATSGKRVSLESILAKGSAVVVFYRGGWCPFCNINLRYLQKHLAEIEAAGGTLVAVSPETPDNSLSTREKNELAFDVLSDPGNKVARAFGLVFRVPPGLVDVYSKFGIDLESRNGDSSFELPLSATFVLDSQGKVVRRFVDVDYKKRMDPVDVVGVLDEIALVRAGIKR